MNIYFRMPRVASWTITNLVQRKAAIIPHSLSPERVRDVWKANPAAFKFTFIRHPYDRFLSAYKWATRAVIDPKTHPLDDVQKGSTLIYETPEKFAEMLARPARPNWLIHFHPQSEYIYEDDVLLVDRVCRYEDLEGEFGRVAKKIGVGGRVQFGPNFKNRFKQAGEIYEISDRLKSALDEVYADDFRLLGYAKEPACIS